VSVEAAVLTLVDEVKKMSERLDALVNRQAVQEFYNTEEFARLAGFESARTVRDYLNQGRLIGIKKRGGRGRKPAWAIPHEELLRSQREGLLPAR